MNQSHCGHLRPRRQSECAGVFRGRHVWVSSKEVWSENLFVRLLLQLNPFFPMAADENMAQYLFGVCIITLEDINSETFLNRLSRFCCGAVHFSSNCWALCYSHIYARTRLHNISTV